MRSPKVTRINAIDRKNGSGACPSAEQRLIVEQAEIVAEPNNGHTGTIPSIQIGGGVPLERLLGYQRRLVGGEVRDSHQWLLRSGGEHDCEKAAGDRYELSIQS